MPSVGPQLPARLRNDHTHDADDVDDDNEVVGPRIGPAIPPQLLRRPQEDDVGFGPQLPAGLERSRPKSTDNTTDETVVSIGPSLPPHLRKSAGKLRDEATVGPTRSPPMVRLAPPPAPDNDDEDDYMPALPPDLRTSQSAPPKRVIGPSFPTGPPPPPNEDEDDYDEVGPMPPAPWEARKGEDGVSEFLERERRRAESAAEASKPKKLQRDEWMLVPPTSSSLLSSIDPTKLRSKRQFSNSAAPAANKEGMELWTETPQERLERLKAEVTGKRKRAVDSATDEGDEEEKRLKRRRDEEIRRRVEEHNRHTARTESLVEMHSSKQKGQKKDDKDDVIWDRERDMSIGGRLMEDGKRKDLIKEAKGLGGRFERGQTGGYL